MKHKLLMMSYEYFAYKWHRVLLYCTLHRYHRNNNNTCFLINFNFHSFYVNCLSLSTNFYFIVCSTKNCFNYAQITNLNEQFENFNEMKISNYQNAQKFSSSVDMTSLQEFFSLCLCSFHFNATYWKKSFVNHKKFSFISTLKPRHAIRTRLFADKIEKTLILRLKYIFYIRC